MNHTIFVLKKIPLGMLFLGNSFIWKVQYNRCSKVHIDCQLSQTASNSSRTCVLVDVMNGHD